MNARFDLILKATDPVGAVSDEVMIPVRLKLPLPQMYLVDQTRTGFRPVTVGYRNAKHTMELGDWPTAETGFYFAEAAIGKLKGPDGISLVVPDTEISSGEIAVMTAAPTDVDADVAPANTQVIVIKASGRVNDLAAADLTWASGANPMLMFSVSGAGSGTITLTYYVWADKDGKNDSDVTPDTLDVDTWKKAAEATIVVTVK